MIDRMTGLVDVTYSEVRDFAHCPRKWFLHYGKKLAPRSVKPNLSIGSLVHVWLGWLHSPELDSSVPTLKAGLNALDRAYEQLVDERGLSDPHGGIMETGKDVVERYLKWWKSNNTDIVTIGTEINYEVPIFSWIPAFHMEGTLHGRVDWIFRKAGKLWVVDHKCVKRFSPGRYLYSMQGPIYGLGYTKISGICPDFIGYSLIRRQATKSNRPDVSMITVQTDQTVLRLIEENLSAWMRRMRKITIMDLGANYGSDCSWMCNYLSICEMMRGGKNTRRLIESMYYVREVKDLLTEENQNS